MNLYEKYCLPHLVNCACSSKQVVSLRRKVVALAEGKVLEVGMGGALNLPFYDPEKVDLVWGLEPSEEMRGPARKTLHRTPIDVRWIPLPAEKIPLEDESIDTVLLTFTLCTIRDWRAALLQMRRVLKPEGKLLFCEHGAAPDDSVRRWQERLTPFWKRIAGGCHLDRPIPGYIENAGFRIDRMERGYSPGVPKIAGFIYWGTAQHFLQSARKIRPADRTRSVGRSDGRQSAGDGGRDGTG